MKKILLSLGTAAAIATPIAAVIACAPTTDVLSKSEIEAKFREEQGKDINQITKETIELSNEQQMKIVGELRSATTVDELRDIMNNSLESL